MSKFNWLKSTKKLSLKMFHRMIISFSEKFGEYIVDIMIIMIKIVIKIVF
jgi:hypothetical protein